MKAIDIGTRRECFFDDYLIDTEKTTAEFMVHQPTRRETVMVNNLPWEGDGSTSQHLLWDGQKWHLHYIGRKMENATSKDEELLYVNCLAFSEDGLKWEKPVLNICAYNGSTENNILSVRNRNNDDIISTVMSPFYDENPDCPENEKFKTIHVKHLPEHFNQLWMVPSSDGIHFDRDKAFLVDEGGYYDSIACCFWDNETKKYRLYIREYYLPDEYKNMFKSAKDEASYTYYRKRGIAYMESTDCKNWSKRKMIAFTNEVIDAELYENKIQPYYRAPHMYIGFPTRYNGRCYNGQRGWPKNMDEMCGKEARQKRYEKEDRFGVATTDCIFISSRDGENFYRHDEAFMRPGPENGTNWKYGDRYPAWGLIETPSPIEGEQNEISMLVPEKSWLKDVEVVRYAIRLDGFVSLHSGGKEKVIITKPFTFRGENLYANLSTSAYGYMYFTLTAEDGTTAESYEIFGDDTDKKISFTEPEKIKELQGKTVVMTVKMLDADLYAIRFGK